MKKRHLFFLVLIAIFGVWVWNKIADISVVKESRTKTILPAPVEIKVSPLVLVNTTESSFKSITFSMNLTLDEVEAGKCAGDPWQDFWFRDCLKMQVPAEINAGFGRDILDQRRFTSTSETVTFNLGTPVIYRPNIIHARVKVLNPEDDGGAWSDPDKNLQAKAFAEAEKDLRQIACRAGILKSAALSAEKQYGDLLRFVLKTAGDVRTVKIVYDIPDCKNVL